MTNEMTVERLAELRKLRDLYREDWEWGWEMQSADTDALADAVDEIDRLRAELSSATASAHDAVVKLAAKDAEIERLTEMYELRGEEDATKAFEIAHLRAELDARTAPLLANDDPASLGHEFIHAKWMFGCHKCGVQREFHWSNTLNPEPEE